MKDHSIIIKLAQARCTSKD